MNKKKFAVLALLMIALVVLSSAMLVACNKDDDKTSDKTQTIEATKGLLISNGDFKVIDTASKTYPRSITSWTGSKSFSSGDYRDDVISGAISLKKDDYDANKSTWNDKDDVLYNKLVAGGRYGDDDKIKNALMVYMPEESEKDGKKINGPTAYGYTSSSFTIAKGGYYKLTVDVLTHNIKGKNKNDTPGARIYLSSNTYAEVDAIDTKGEWKTYTFYIEGSPSSASTLNVLLALGKYSTSYTTGLTTGYAVFDNLSLTKLEGDSEYVAAVEQEKTFSDLSSLTTRTATLKTPNGRFDFGTTTLSSSGTPNSWSIVTGNSGKNDSAPSSLGYNAVIDVKNFKDNFKNYSGTYYVKSKGSADSKNSYVPADKLVDISDEIMNLPQGTVGSNVFMLSQQMMTAQGIKSSRAITIEKNKTYALSLNVYTYGVHGAGASLVLSGSDGKDITIKGISSSPSDDILIGSTKIDSESYDNGTVDGQTTSGWTTYTFYIKGNQFKDYNYNMTVWLGTEGTASNTAVEYLNMSSDKKQTTYKANGTFANGWLFMDELNLKEIDALPNADDVIEGKNDNQTLDLTAAGKANRKGFVVDLSTENTLKDILSVGASSNYPEGIKQLGAGIPNGWVPNYDLTDSKNPIVKGLISHGVIALGQEGTPAMPYALEDARAYQIKASGDSRYEIETQKITIKKDQYYRFSMWVKTEDVKCTSGAYVSLVKKGESADKDSVLTTFSQINTNSDENGFDPYLNDWCELTTFVKGSDKEDIDVTLKFALGSGDRWASSTLASGSMYVANVNGALINQTIYDGASTGNYVKTANLASSSISYPFTNGAFDDYDAKDENLKENTSLKDQDIAATPSNWTFSDKTLKPNTNESGLVAGVISLEKDGNKFKHTNQTDKVFPNIAQSTFDNFYKDLYAEGTDLNNRPGNKPQILAIGSNDNTKSHAAGFSSNSVTLSANSFYALSVYARTVGNTKFSIYLTGESSVDSGNGHFTVTKTDADWTKYTFYIRTGQSSVSLKLNLWLGEDSKYSAQDLSEDAAKSSGAVFFDNVHYTKIDEERFNSEAKEDATNRTLSFLTDSFDSLSSTVESRKSLATPNGWTGSLSGTASAKATKSGIVYADNNFYEVETVDGKAYARILGADYTVDNDLAKPTDEEIAAARKDEANKGKTDDEIIAALKQAKVVELKKNNWIPVEQLQAHSGKQMLVINNTEKSAYTYTSSAITLKEASYYEISLWAKTYGVKGDDDISGVNVELFLGSANESDKPFAFTAIKGDNGWTKYTFYVKTMDNDVTNVTVKLSLGKYEAETVNGETKVTGITSGYAMFDDVTVKTVTQTEYDNATESSTVLKRQVTDETQGKGDDNNGENKKPDKTFNTEALWWMIPTIVLAVLIIVVLIVYVVRKVRKPVAKKKDKKAASLVETPSLDAKHNKYDENKE